MKITQIDTYLVGNPVPARGGPTWLFVKLSTDEGIVGFGECNIVIQRYRSLVQVIKDFGEMYVLGADPFKIELLWETLFSGGFHYMRCGGMLSSQALGAIEMACWDIVGKAAKQPIYNLLGGKINDTIPSYTYIYSHCTWLNILNETPERYARAARECVNDGFKAVKLDPIAEHPAPRNLDIKELRYVESIYEAIYKEIGNEAQIIIGTHGQLCTHTAITLAKLLEPFRPLWYEEPVQLENYDEMARVAAHTSIAIATGERLIGINQFQPLLQKQAAQIVQPNVSLNGILGTKKIASLAQAHYAQIAPWMHCGPIGLAVAVHIDACSPNFLIQETIGKNDGFHKEIVNEYIELKDGCMIPPDRPGLGVELTEDVMSGKYPGAVPIQRTKNR